MHAMYSACLDGATSTCSGVAGIPFSRTLFSATACRSSGIPREGVYFVCPASRAFFAASTMWAGVGKSGSPTLRERTGSPRARISATRFPRRTVGEDSIDVTRFAKRAMVVGNAAGYKRFTATGEGS